VENLNRNNRDFSFETKKAGPWDPPLTAKKVHKTPLLETLPVNLKNSVIGKGILPYAHIHQVFNR